MGFFSSGSGSNYSQVNVASFENGAIRVKKGVITGIRVEQDARISENMTSDPHDIAVRMKVQYGGPEGFEREEYIGGWLKREKTAHGWGPPVSLGRVWNVAWALMAAGANLEEAESEAGIDLTTDFSKENVLAVFEEAVQQGLVGETVYFLDYVKGTYEGKASYSTWTTIAGAREEESDDEVAENLYNKWQDQRAKGYVPRNFAPEVIAELAAAEAAPVNNGAASGNSAAYSGTKPPF